MIIDLQSLMNTLLRILVIAQQAMKEAWHSRFYLLLAAIVAVCAGLGLFAGELVLTGSQDTRLTIYNFTIRLALVAVFAVYIIQSLSRERIEKQAEVILSLDIPREVYVSGRLLGFMAVLVSAVIMASLFSLWQVSIGVASGWALSLFAELCIIGFLAMFVAVGLNNPAICFSLVAGFYLLARNMGNLLLLSQSPILENAGASVAWAKSILTLLNVLLPDMWRFAPSQWLIDDMLDSSALMMNLVSAGVFCMLLAVATGFDLHRKNL